MIVQERNISFEVVKAKGNNPNVNIGNALVFKAELNDGIIRDSNFTGAVPSSSGVGSGSVGAHLQSLSDDGCSGFVWGDWGDTATGTVGDGSEVTCGVGVPEPGTMGLLGLGLLGMALRRRTAKAAI